MRILRIISCLALLLAGAVGASAQSNMGGGGGGGVLNGTGAPAGVCAPGSLYTNNSNGNLYSCNAGTWGLAGGGGVFPITVSGTVNSGGIPCFTSATNEASSALLVQYGILEGGGAGVCPSTVSPPTTPNSVPYFLTSTPAGGVGSAYVNSLAGVPINAQTGTTYTIAATDRSGVVTTSNVGATAITLPSAASTNFQNSFNHALFNINSGLVTITPTTSTINGAATQIVPNKWGSFIYSDNVNYRALTVPDIAAFPSCADSGGNHLNFTTATGALSCGTTTSAASTALSAIVAAAGGNTINNGDNQQVWNWQLTTAGAVGLAIAENVASTSTGAPALVTISTLAGTTAVPLAVKGRSGPDDFDVYHNGALTHLWNGFGYTESGWVKAGGDVWMEVNGHPLQLTVLPSTISNKVFTFPGDATGVPEIGYCANVTPVTLPGTSTTAAQNLLACTIETNVLNLVGRTIRIYSKDNYTTAAGNLSTIEHIFQLCSVSGCATGNITKLCDITSTANPGTVTNNAIISDCTATVQTAGAASRFEASGDILVDLGALTTSAASAFTDINTATLAGSPSDLNLAAASVFLQETIAFSIANAGNVATGRQMTVEIIK